MGRSAERSSLALALGLGLFAAAPGHAATSNELEKCQKQFTKEVRKLQKTTLTQLFKCLRRATECKLADEIDSEDPTKCLTIASLVCDKAVTKVDQKELKGSSKVVLKCGLIPIGELETFVGGLGFFDVAASCSAGDAGALIDCVFADTRCSAEQQAFILEPRAQDSLTEVGVEASFPCVAP